MRAIVHAPVCKLNRKRKLLSDSYPAEYVVRNAVYFRKLLSLYQEHIIDMYKPCMLCKGAWGPVFDGTERGRCKRCLPRHDTTRSLSSAIPSATQPRHTAEHPPGTENHRTPGTSKRTHLAWTQHGEDYSGVLVPLFGMNFRWILDKPLFNFWLLI